jgi:simple sugar transport system permease protein
MALGALASAATGIYFPHLQAGIAPIFGALAAFAFGSIWGLIPGWLRAFRGSHEVINTIMLNFIAAGICSWATLYLLKDPESQSPQTQPVGSNYLIHHLQFFGEAPVNRAIFLALALAVIIWFLLQKTVLGYEIRAVGQNEEAARAVGIQASRIRMIAMSIAGGLAGLVGVNEVFGSAGRFKVDFSPGYGFTGIAVALLGRSHPFGVVVAALLFGALHKGATDLDLETENVTRDLSLVLQAFVILCVCAEGLWSSQFFKRLKAFKKEDRSSVSL